MSFLILLFGTVAFAGMFLEIDGKADDSSLDDEAIDADGGAFEGKDIDGENQFDSVLSEVSYNTYEEDSALDVPVVIEDVQYDDNGVVMEEAIGCTQEVDAGYDHRPDVDYISRSFSITESFGVPPLSGWALSPDFETVDLAETDDILVQDIGDFGSIQVIQADYYERVSDEQGDIVHNVNAGANVYFIPNGNEFPTEYKWSESGANLYNTLTLDSDESDFGEIRLILRIDTGYFYGDNESIEAYEFKARAFAELKDRFLSDGEVVYNIHPIV